MKLSSLPQKISKFFAWIISLLDYTPEQKQKIIEDCRHRGILYVVYLLKRQGVQSPSLFEIHRELIAIGKRTPFQELHDRCIKLAEDGFLLSKSQKGALHFAWTDQTIKYPKLKGYIESMPW